MKLGKQIGDFFSRILSMALLRLRLMGEVHYINGPETLPPPLSSEEEAEIMQQYPFGKGGSQGASYHP